MDAFHNALLLFLRFLLTVPDISENYNYNDDAFHDKMVYHPGGSSALPDISLTTDIIVGFPGETEEEFKTTCDFAKTVSFAQIHVFKYSRRHGTVADRMEDQVDEQVKNSRSDRLLAIEAELEKQYQQKFSDQTQKVLIEEPVLIEGTKYLVGYNERYVRIAVPYEEGVSDESLCNSLIDVHINGSLEGDILLGKRERACNL